MLEIHADSHVDHLEHISKAVVDFVLDKFKDKNEPFTATVELPVELGRVPCGLYGPLMGDPPILDNYAGVTVAYKRRGNRPYNSRLVSYPMRMVDTVTVIGGPHDGKPCVLYTLFGGPLTPREPGDPGLASEADKVASLTFWAQHALADSHRTA